MGKVKFFQHARTCICRVIRKYVVLIRLRCETQPFWGKIQKLTLLFQRGKFCLWPSLSASWPILVLQQSSTSEFNSINHERILRLNVVKISLTRVTLYHYTYFPFLCSLFLSWTKQNSPLFHFH